MKKETKFSEVPGSDEEESNSYTKKAEIEVTKRKTSFQFTEAQEIDWIRKNIRTKVRVKSEEDNEEDVIKEVEANSFGMIEFIGAARTTNAKFVRMSDETPVDTIFELLTEQWKLPEPQILIYITGGGAKLFKIEENLKEFLVEGLRKITQSPSTWVITEGTNDGVTKFVGESLQGVTKSLIGISSAETTNAKDLYVGDRDMPLGSRIFDHEVADSITDWKTDLDHNHPYHLLVDGFSIFVSLVSRLLEYGKDREAPAVMLLLEGVIISLENVIKAVAGEQPIPVLVVNGSGQAADVLSYAMQSCNEIDLSGKIIHKGLADIIQESGARNWEAYMIYTLVLECLEHKHMISVVTVDKEEGLDVKILEAIMKSYHLEDKQCFRYTVLWNRVDMAEDLFLRPYSDVWEKSLIFFLMVMALALNRYKFVEYFVKHNVSIHKFVSQPLLEFLYGHRSSRQRSIVKHCVARSSSRPVHHDFYKWLNGKETMNDESAKIISYEDISNLLSSLCKTMNLDMPQEYILHDSRAEDDDELNSYSKYPHRDIFLWAVVNNMQDMAKVLWKLGDEQIAKAIVAAEINKKLAEKAEEKNLSNEIIQVLKKNGNEFKELALNMLDSCYIESPWKTKVLLTSELAQFSSQNCMQNCIRLANESCFQEFIAHKAVQQVLNELWCGKLSYESHLIKIKDIRNNYANELKKEDNAVESNKSTEPKNQLIDGKKRSYGTYTNRTYISQDGQQQYNGSDNQNKHSITKVLSYHFDVPVRKFIGSLVSYCIFLMLISYCAVLKKEDATPNVIEIIVFVWVVSYTMEEIYQASVTSDATISHKLSNHLKSFFNVVDVTALTLYFIAFVLQLNSSSMEYGHLLYAIDAMLWIVRLLQYFYASKILGTYVIMIGRMFIDMCYFISILVVFLLAYGVLSSAILRPETRIFKMIKNTVYFPYFNIYGELFADSDSSPGMTKFGTKVINDYSEPISWVFLGLFLLISNVLLLNLLIAVFGNTFAEVKEKADQIWRFNRHNLVTEYALKLSVPPPFTVFIFIWKMLSTLKRTSKLDRFSWKYSYYHREIREFQTTNVINVLRVQETELQKYPSNEKLEKLNEENKTLQEQITNLNKTMETNNDVLKLLQEQTTNLNKTTAKIENYFTQMNALPKND